MCRPFSTPTCAGCRYCILFIHKYACDPSVWVLPGTTSTTCTSSYESFVAWDDSLGVEVKRVQCDIRRRKYDNKTFRPVLAALGTTYESYPPHCYNENGVAKCMIQRITNIARSMMIDSQPQLGFWTNSVSSAVYLNQGTPNEGWTKRNNHHGYKAPYSTPWKTLYSFSKCSHDIDRNKISYKCPLHHLQWFGCYVSRLIPEPQCDRNCSPRSKPCMMVSYIND